VPRKRVTGLVKGGGVKAVAIVEEKVDLPFRILGLLPDEDKGRSRRRLGGSRGSSSHCCPGPRRILVLVAAPSPSPRPHPVPVFVASLSHLGVLGASPSSLCPHPRPRCVLVAVVVLGAFPSLSWSPSGPTHILLLVMVASPLRPTPILVLAMSLPRPCPHRVPVPVVVVSPSSWPCSHRVPVVVVVVVASPSHPHPHADHHVMVSGVGPSRQLQRRCRRHSLSPEIPALMLAVAFCWRWRWRWRRLRRRHQAVLLIVGLGDGGGREERRGAIRAVDAFAYMTRFKLRVGV
jgi:hypothetical protein